MTLLAFQAALLSSSAVSAEGAPKKSPEVRISLSPEARVLLGKRKMTFDGGVLRKRGSKDGRDLLHGSGELYAILHPDHPNSLIVVLYDRGKRWATLEIDFDWKDPALMPLDGAVEARVRKFFPKDKERPILSEAAIDTDCVVVSMQRRNYEGASGPAESDPCFGAPPAARCDASAVSAELRGLYVERLALLPDDETGRAASEFLRRSTSTAFTVLDMGKAMEPGVSATYEPTRDSIQLPNTFFKPLWAKIKDSRLPPEARGVAEGTAAALVHELRHARQYHETGIDAPGFLESESLAFADQGLFLWARLEKDPDYIGMGTYNRVLLSTAGLASPPRRWWTQPLKTEELARLHEFNEPAKRLAGDALTSDTANHWFLARSLAGGLAGMEANLAWTGKPGISIFTLPADFAAKRQENTERSIAKMEKCLAAETDPDDRREFELRLRHLKGRRRLYAEPARFQEILDYYRRERAKQQADIDRRLRLLGNRNP